MKINRFIPGFLVASLIFGGTAYAVSVNNTSAGGYLLCGNPKTKDVTFPGTLKCPAGTTPIEVPGRGQVIVDEQSDSTAPVSSSTGSKGTPNCTLAYITKNPSEANQVLEACSSTQINQLIKDYSKYQQDFENRIQTEKDKLKALQDKAAASRGTTTAQEALDAVTAQSQIVADLIATTKSQITLMSSIVIAIQKKVKAG